VREQGPFPTLIATVRDVAPLVQGAVGVWTLVPVRDGRLRAKLAQLVAEEARGFAMLLPAVFAEIYPIARQVFASLALAQALIRIVPAFIAAIIARMTSHSLSLALISRIAERRWSQNGYG